MSITQTTSTSPITDGIDVLLDRCVYLPKYNGMGRQLTQKERIEILVHKYSELIIHQIGSEDGDHG